MSTTAQSPSTLLGNLTPAEFLKRHWQKEPLFIKQAMPGYQSPLDADELAGLACEENAEARLVTANPDSPYRLEFGPFDAQRFTELGTANWTLLVQDVDKWIPKVAELLQDFAFIPSWRVDDIMVSFATPGGSVGPHTDNYDVFLLQVAGQRRWQLSRVFDPTRLRTDTELAVLQHFSAEREWLAEPGDLLYLPPNIAHYGVAQSDCLTFSIGMRAPSDRELLRQFVQALDDDESAALDQVREQRYSDPDLEPSEHPGLIGEPQLRRLSDLLRSAVSQPETSLQRWLAATLSAGKPYAEGHASASWQDELAAPRSVADLERRLRAGDLLLQNPAVRFCYIRTSGTLYLYADGKEYPLDPSLENVAALISGRRPFNAQDLGELTEPASSALQSMVEQGWLRVDPKP